jgi:hypothetical protein
MKLGYIPAAALIIGAAASAQADSIRLDTSTYSSGIGGEFRATQISGYAGQLGGSTSLSAGSFQTFCLEHGENFRPGDIYNLTLNTAAVFGGTGGGSDPLDDRTAYLYTMFRAGTLAGYDYGAGRQASAGQLQDAIWFLEAEAGGVNNGFVALANAAVSFGGDWYGRGLGNVRVLNLSNEEFLHAQDQLTMIPLPLAASMGLAGIPGLALRRRR